VIVRAHLWFARVCSFAGASAIAVCAGAGHDHGAHWTELPGFLKQTGFMAAPGQPASAAHPRGTVILARPLKGKGVTLTEWDLALEGVVREVELGWPQTELEVVRSGDTLHLVVARPRVVYATLNARTLRIEQQVDLGPGDRPIVASDGTLSIVSWIHAATWYAATIDARGRVLARLGRPIGPQPWGPHPLRLAVLGGHAYMLMGENAVAAHILRLSAMLAIEKDLRYVTNEYASLVVTAGHIVVGANDGFAENSPDLDVVAHHRHWTGDDAPLFAANDAGRIVTTYGDVFASPAQPPVARYPVAHDDDAAMVPLWVGGVPVLLEADSPSGTIGTIEWIDLADPDRPPARPPPSP